MKDKPAATTRSTLVSLTRAAADVGLPYSTLRESIIRGDLPHVRLSGRGRYWVKRADLDRFIEKSTETGVER